MKAEIEDTELLYSVDYYVVDVAVNGKAIKMKVTVDEGRVSEYRADPANDWNNLSFDEKHEVREALLNYNWL